MKLRSLVPILLCLSLAGCGGKTPPTVPTGSTVESQTTAKIGYQALGAIEVLDKTVAQLETAGSIKTDAAAKVMIASHKAGGIGNRLSDALTLYDQVKAQGQSTTANAISVNALLTEFESAVKAISGVDVGSGTAAQIAQLVTAIFDAINTLKATFKPVAMRQIMTPLGYIDVPIRSALVAAR